jgi:hypothetical protein
LSSHGDERTHPRAFQPAERKGDDDEEDARSPAGRCGHAPPGRK